MKYKQRILTICMFIVIISGGVFLSRNVTKTTYSLTQIEYGTYEDAQKIIKEVMKDYYIKGPNIQYQNVKRQIASPEEGTIQDNKYMVCSGYSENVYTEAFGFTANGANANSFKYFPKYSANFIYAGGKYNYDNSCTNGNCDDSYLIYYEKTTNAANTQVNQINNDNEDEEYNILEEDDIDEIDDDNTQTNFNTLNSYNVNNIGKIKYAYGGNTSFSDFAQMIQPGDIISFTGHVQIAYDKVWREDKQSWDVLILNSNGINVIPSRITKATRKTNFTYRNNPSGANDIVDVDIEGGIQYKWLSSFSSRYVGGIIKPKVDTEEKYNYFTQNGIHPVYSLNCIKKEFRYYLNDGTGYTKTLDGLKSSCQTDSTAIANGYFGRRAYGAIDCNKLLNLNELEMFYATINEEGKIERHLIGSCQAEKNNVFPVIEATDAVDGNNGHEASKLNCNTKQLYYYDGETNETKELNVTTSCNGKTSSDYVGAPKSSVGVWCDDNMTMFSYIGYTSDKENNQTWLHDLKNQRIIGSCKGVENFEIKCATDECSVIRPFYEGENGQAVFNYDIDTTKYDKSKLRIDEFPGLYIEKTVNKGDNNSVYPGDELEYTIKIVNMSNSVKDDTSVVKKYENFNVKETIDKNTSFVGVTSNDNFTYSLNANNDLTHIDNIEWTIKELAIGQSIELKYKVIVNNSINGKIEEVGKLYKTQGGVSISTGTIKNNIIPKISNPQKKSYQACYNEIIEQSNYNKSGLSLIDDIYNCSRTDISFKFADENGNDIFKFNGGYKFAKNNEVIIENNDMGLFKRYRSNDTQINFNTSSEYNNKIKKMVLNDYWGGIAAYNDSGTINVSPLFFNSNSTLRARKSTFRDADFKDGDVLIYSIDYDIGVQNPYYYVKEGNESERIGKEYLKPSTSNINTKEKGLYAFIYINGKFVGINGSDNTARNEFTYKYYENTDLFGQTGIINHLYNNVESLELGNNKEFYLTRINYDTLLDKDYYVILRPELTIENNDDNKVKTSISIKTYPNKRNYNIGEDFDLTGLQVSVNYSNGDMITTEDISWSIPNTSTPGVKNIVIEHDGLKTSIPYNVEDKKYKISYYQGNGTATTGNTKFSPSTECIYNTNCTIANYTDLTTNQFPLNSNGWNFAGYSTSFLGITRDYIDGETFTYNMDSDLDLYAVGVRNFRFSSGIAPTTNSGKIPQYWNPYQIGTSYVTSISVPAAAIINGWTFIGYRANNIASATVTIALTPTYKPSAESLTSFDFRAIYQRDISIIFDANGGMGTTASITKKQYYNSGFGNGINNTGANISNISFKLPTNNFTKEGYIFKGWGEEPSTTNFNLAESDYTNFNPEINSEIITKTLYAIWEPAVITTTQEIETTNPIESNPKTSTNKTLIPLIILIIVLIFDGLIYILRDRIHSKKEESITPKTNNNTNNYDASLAEQNVDTNNNINNDNNRL